MQNSKPYIRLFLTLVVSILLITTSCSKRVYYSSERVYNAQREQQKRLKRKGYSNQQYRNNPRKATGYQKKRRFSKRKHKYGGVKKFGK